MGEKIRKSHKSVLSPFFPTLYPNSILVIYTLCMKKWTDLSVKLIELWQIHLCNQCLDQYKAKTCKKRKTESIAFHPVLQRLTCCSCWLTVHSTSEEIKVITGWSTLCFRQKKLKWDRRMLCALDKQGLTQLDVSQEEF